MVFMLYGFCGMSACKSGPILQCLSQFGRQVRYSINGVHQIALHALQLYGENDPSVVRREEEKLNV